MPDKTQILQEILVIQQAGKWYFPLLKKYCQCFGISNERGVGFVLLFHSSLDWPLEHFYIWQVSAMKKKPQHILTQAQIISICKCYQCHWSSCFSHVLCLPGPQEGVCRSRGTPSARKMLTWGSPCSRGSAHHPGFLKCWYIPILNTHHSKPQHLATEEHPVRKYLIHTVGGFVADMDKSLWSLSLS